MIKKKPKQKKISGLNTVLHLVPNESLLTGAWRRCKGNLRAAVITELLQIAVLSCLLPPGSQTSIYLLGLSPVRVEGSQLPLSLCHTWYWQLNSPWDPGPMEVFSWEDYRDVLWLALFLLRFLYKTKLAKQRDSVTAVLGWTLLPWWNHVPGRWEGVSPCSAPGQCVHFWHCSIQARSALRHHNILSMLLTAEKPLRLLLNYRVMEPPKAGWSWDGKIVCIHTHVYKENPYCWGKALRAFVLKRSSLFDEILK